MSLTQGRSQKKNNDTNYRIKPSEFLKRTSIDVDLDDYPMIVGFVNIQDNSNQIHTSVDIDRPLFHPSPVVVIFDGYKPFNTIERKLFFRNNDKVK
jgi:hypothetical protein